MDSLTNNKKPFWLASYPKSGNTWVRSFIVALNAAALGKPQNIFDLNGMDIGDIASDQSWLEELAGFDLSDLSQDEIDQFRPDAHLWLAEHASETRYHKIHDANRLIGNDYLLPPDASSGIVYIVRNPLDVCISFAHHFGCSIDRSILNMGDPYFSIGGRSGHLNAQLRQVLLSWSQHVLSWVELAEPRLFVVRYEDLILQPNATFSKLARFLSLPANSDVVKGALEQVHFDRLQAMELKNGFVEKTRYPGLFFRKGRLGDWQSVLTPAQTRQIINDHQAVMKKLGYLDENGELTALAGCE